jgi:hypothetical protein
MSLFATPQVTQSTSAPAPRVSEQDLDAAFLRWTDAAARLLAGDADESEVYRLSGEYVALRDKWMRDGMLRGL